MRSLGKKAIVDVFSGREETCWMGWAFSVQEKADLGTLLTFHRKMTAKGYQGCECVRSDHAVAVSKEADVLMRILMINR